jgi:dolichol-phosphate mannosyltransferase
MALVSVVVPVYHNAASLPMLLARLQELARANPEEFEFVFVDDGSGDDSFGVLQELSRDEPQMRVLRLSRNFGSSAAILAGLDHAVGDVVAVIAADLQDPPEMIADMVEHWRQGRKVVLAARHSRGDSWTTRFMAAIYYRLFRRFALERMPPGGFDCFLVDRRVADLLRSIPENNVYLMGLLLWLGFDPIVLPYHRAARAPEHGRSRWTFARKVKYLIDGFVGFSYLPMRAAWLAGLLLGLVGLLGLAIVLGRRLFLDRPIPEWGAVTLVILVVSGVQLLMTGILGEYLWRNLEETRRRPRYIVEHILNPCEART